MRKTLLFVALFIISGRLMAQNATVAPFDNTLSNKLTQPFKADSAWRNLQAPADSFLKQGDINKIYQQNALLAQVKTSANNGYNMPVYVLEGRSKMPVKKLDGYYSMPVAGKDKQKPLTPVIP